MRLCLFAFFCHVAVVASVIAFHTIAIVHSFYLAFAFVVAANDSTVHSHPRTFVTTRALQLIHQLELPLTATKFTMQTYVCMCYCCCCCRSCGELLMGICVHKLSSQWRMNLFYFYFYYFFFMLQQQRLLSCLKHKILSFWNIVYYFIRFIKMNDSIISFPYRIYSLVDFTYRLLIYIPKSTKSMQFFSNLKNFNA